MSTAKFITFILLVSSFCSANDLRFYPVPEGHSPPSAMSPVDQFPSIGEPSLVIAELVDVVRKVSVSHSTLIGLDGKPEKSQVSERPAIVITLPKGFDAKFEKLTADNIGRNIMIVYDGTILAAPIIHQSISTDRFEITLGTPAEADTMYEKLKTLIQKK